jgi:hypothetical protein
VQVVLVVPVVLLRFLRLVMVNGLNESEALIAHDSQNRRADECNRSPVGIMQKLGAFAPRKCEHTSSWPGYRGNREQAIANKQ